VTLIVLIVLSQCFQNQCFRGPWASECFKGGGGHFRGGQNSDWWYGG